MKIFKAFFLALLPIILILNIRECLQAKKVGYDPNVIGLSVVIDSFDENVSFDNTLRELGNMKNQISNLAKLFDGSFDGGVIETIKQFFISIYQVLKCLFLFLYYSLLDMANLISWGTKFLILR